MSACTVQAAASTADRPPIDPGLEPSTPIQLASIRHRSWHWSWHRCLAWILACQIRRGAS